MALKNLFDMVKADRYTQDGREAIIKAQEAETEDKVYQIGEISQKTGLQKTANGWVKPKNGKQPGAKKEESKAAPKSLAGTPMKKADLNSKDPYEITHSMKPDTASEAKEMDKISAFMQEETGATLRNAITARESFYKNTKNPTPEQQEGLAALMKIQQKLGYGKPAEGPALNGQKKTVSHQEYRDGPMYGPAGSKPALSQTDGKGNKVEIKITESKGGGFYVDKYVNGKKVGINNANTRESAEAKAKSMMEQHMADPDYRVESKSAEPQRSEAYKRGEKLAKPAEQRQSAGYRYWQGVLSGYDDESLLEQRKSLQEQVDDFEDDIKRYDKQDMANAVYAKRIDAKNFQIGALKAIDEEMESRGMDPAPRTSVPDAAPSLSEIVDRVYNIGEISEKTGLQKTANGWRPVKKGAAGKTSRASKEEAIRKDLGLTAGEDMSRFSDEQIEKMYAKTQQTPEQQKADFDKSKIGQAVNKGRQEFAAEKARQKELASKTNAIGLPKENKPAAPVKRNEAETVKHSDGTESYRIKGTQFYFKTPEEAESALLTESRYGKSYATASKDPEINNIQETLGFKLDMLGSGKSMDKFMKKTGENEYAANVWGFGTDSKGTLITPLDETDKPNSVIKKENGEWKLHYKDRNGKETVVTANGRQDPTGDSAPRVLTGDTRIRVRKA